jgi:hypothetical protein
MRKPLLFLAVVALATAACPGGAARPGASFDPGPPAHHQPTPRPWQDQPAPTP